MRFIKTRFVRSDPHSFSIAFACVSCAFIFKKTHVAQLYLNQSCPRNHNYYCMSEKCSNGIPDVRKCFSCGFPECPCLACLQIAEKADARAKGKSHAAHSCELSNFFIKCQWPATGVYNDESNSKLQNAWLDVGASKPPVFSKMTGNSGYLWPAELARATASAQN